MSQAENLLSTIAEEDWPSVDSTHETEPMIIIDENRVIHVPAELRRIAVQHDHNIEMVWFKCPRYWDSWDLSEMAVYINVKTPDDKLVSHAARSVNPNPVDNTMTFTWTITRDITQVKGQLTFLVCIKKTDEFGLENNHWNSELNKEMYISEGLECEVESVLDPYPALVTDILTRLSSLENGSSSGGTSSVSIKSGITIPSGRAKGDVNGDGQISEEDYDIVMNVDVEATTLTDPVEIWAADVSNDGAIETLDASLIMSYYNRSDLARYSPYAADYYERWSWDNTQYRYYYDIAMPGITETHSAIVMLRNTSSAFNYDVNCVTDAVRIYSDGIPTKEVLCDIILSATSGDSSVITVTTTDTTLSIAGVPADAKAVGDILGDISSILDSINGEVI